MRCSLYFFAGIQTSNPPVKSVLPACSCKPDSDVIHCFFFLCVAVQSIETVTALYGETIVIPCNNGAPPPRDLMFTKWKYEKDDGTPGDLLIKQVQKSEAMVQATDDYAQRVSIAANSSLLISHGSLKDQRIFTCMVVSASNLLEFPVNVSVQSEPFLRYFTQSVGTCVVKDANPTAEVTWTKNALPLAADGKAVVVIRSVRVDPATGLSTTSSTLQYTATKNDINANFTCKSTHLLAVQETTPESFSIHYPSEKVSLQILPRQPLMEGDNVTLKCHADGNPPPSSFFFHIMGQKLLVENSDTYTLTAVSRASTGEYKCSLVDNEEMEDSQSIVVNYLDLSLTPTGMVVKTVGDTLVVEPQMDASGDPKVSWTKDGKVTKAPAFGPLTYADAGVYVCEVTMTGFTRRQSFELVVEGGPVITGLTKHRADDGKHKVLICEAEGVPEPSFQWSINGTDEEISYHNGKATHKITVTPRANLSVSCIVTNKLGEDFKTINVSSGSQEDAQDQATLIVGVVVGLLIAAGLVGLIYWLYMRNSRQGSWKTGEKEVGTSEESKKLEENNHNV
uniref:Activated leukocyte cell adhesion molecule a n=1 Tax=Myripristis murdjan TaxID=586833 RepID=A0A667WRV9_9TELE